MEKPASDPQELGERILRVLEEQQRPMGLKEIGREIGISDMDRLFPAKDYLLVQKRIEYGLNARDNPLGPYQLPPVKT